MVSAVIRCAPSSVNASVMRARAPSVAKPQPHAARRKR